jgi:hypothetical protein
MIAVLGVNEESLEELKLLPSPLSITWQGKTPLENVHLLELCEVLLLVNHTENQLLSEVMLCMPRLRWVVSYGVLY